jgi:hypothetical protein
VDHPKYESLPKKVMFFFVDGRLWWQHKNVPTKTNFPFFRSVIPCGGHDGMKAAAAA